MDKDLFKGFKMGMGFILAISLLFGISTVGFHLASEILPGTFPDGNYSFNGRIGINTNTPDTILDIVGNTSTPLKLFRDLNIPGGGVGIAFFERDSLLNEQAYAYLYGLPLNVTDGFEDGGFRFDTMTNGVLSEKMRISGNGDIGINTTSPTSTLDVNGDFHANSMDYYTTETFTGKYWINSKPIYRKVILGTMSATGTAFSNGGFDTYWQSHLYTQFIAEDITSAELLLNSNNGYTYDSGSLGRYTAAGLISKINGEIIVTGMVVSGSTTLNFDSQPYTVIVEYTKP